MAARELGRSASSKRPPGDQTPGAPGPRSGPRAVPTSPTSATASPVSLSSGAVDLERREDRYIIYVRDTPELLDDLNKFTERRDFPDSPITRTIYFGDTARGLPPGVSIKARTYERTRLPGRWDVHADSVFQLLEIKRTIPVDREVSERRMQFGRAKPPPQENRLKRDQMVEILRLSSSILSLSTYKSKRRKPQITLAELVKIIGQPTSVRRKVDEQMYVHLLETVHPLSDYHWLPLIGTEYERDHFVTRDDSLRDVFRATLDKRVTHYAFFAHDKGYVGIPVATEDFSRFEVKTDRERIAGTPLGDWLDETVVKFRAFRIPSKKYRGLTLRSEYVTRRQALQNELPNQRLWTEFPSRPVRYKDHEHYVNLARYIQSSGTFRLLSSDPWLLENHEHFVSGRERGLIVTISGSFLRYRRDRIARAVGTLTIYREDRMPVTEVPLTSRHDLDEAKVGTLTNRDTQYIRTRGFLVEHRKSGRVFQVALENRMRARAPAKRFVRIEYAGRARGRPRFDAEAAITKEIRMLHRFLQKDPFLKGE
jgi:hypothetical protein